MKHEQKFPAFVTSNVAIIQRGRLKSANAIHLTSLQSTSQTLADINDGNVLASNQLLF